METVTWMVIPERVATVSKVVLVDRIRFGQATRPHVHEACEMIENEKKTMSHHRTGMQYPDSDKISHWSNIRFIQSASIALEIPTRFRFLIDLYRLVRYEGSAPNIFNQNAVNETQSNPVKLGKKRVVFLRDTLERRYSWIHRGKLSSNPKGGMSGRTQGRNPTICRDSLKSCAEKGGILGQLWQIVAANNPSATLAKTWTSKENTIKLGQHQVNPGFSRQYFWFLRFRIVLFQIHARASVSWQEVQANAEKNRCFIEPPVLFNGVSFPEKSKFFFHFWLHGFRMVFFQGNVITLTSYIGKGFRKTQKTRCFVASLALLIGAFLLIKACFIIIYKFQRLRVILRTILNIFIFGFLSLALL